MARARGRDRLARRRDGEVHLLPTFPFHGGFDGVVGDRLHLYAAGAEPFDPEQERALGECTADSIGDLRNESDVHAQCIANRVP